MAEIKQSEAMRLVAQISRLTKDGEGGFVLENDDAVDTVHGLIDEARRIAGLALEPHE